MSEAQVILEALEDLGEDDFQTFKWYLSQSVLEGYRPIARCHLENAKRTHTVSLLRSSYGPDTALELCVLVLRRMNKNNCAQELLQACAVKKAAVGSAPGAPPAPGTPAAPGTQMTAQDSSVIVAPTVTGGSVGSLNINISK